MLLGSWNSWTNVWLRETIYIRVARADRKPGFKSTLTTFTVSALWHGVNVCYFMTFILGSLIQSLAKQIRRYVRPFFLPNLVNKEQNGSGPQDIQQEQDTSSKFLYDAAGTIATQCMINYIVLPFVVLDVKDSLTAVSANIFSLVILFLLTDAVCHVYTNTVESCRLVRTYFDLWTTGLFGVWGKNSAQKRCQIPLSASTTASHASRRADRPIDHGRRRRFRRSAGAPQPEERAMIDVPMDLLACLDRNSFEALEVVLLHDVCHRVPLLDLFPFPLAVVREIHYLCGP